MFCRILILMLLLPSLAICYTIVRKDGKTFSGELVKQTPEETVLKDKDGTILKFKADQIDWDKRTAEIKKAEQIREKEPQKQKHSFSTKDISKQDAWTGETISFDFKDMDIRDFFLFVGDFTGMNIILDPAVKGTLTMTLKDVPWDQAVDLVCRTYGLGYEIEGNVVSVGDR